ncbi:hypothetical protein EDC96DRAFT_568271 [Choanephora cucurbitarum]|nr:hypothetical protein EDC96DRAFT_568271 [Choanephora cucurbitarum]
MLCNWLSKLSIVVPKKERHYDQDRQKEECIGHSNRATVWRTQKMQRKKNTARLSLAATYDELNGMLVNCVSPDLAKTEELADDTSFVANSMLQTTKILLSSDTCFSHRVQYMIAKRCCTLLTTNPLGLL